MMTCRQISRILSEALDRELTAAERETVVKHLAECPACTRCRGQFEEIRRAVRRLAAA
jgi:anti-sigma factor RsiW